MTREKSPARPKIVAVDGPAGSGKSSLCRRVAERIGWTYITSGAIYRAVGLMALDAGISIEDGDAIVEMLGDVSARLRWEGTSGELWLGEKNLTPRLQSEEAGYAASKVAKLPQVRQALLPMQRQITLAATVGALVDGRDIGTVVFPDADLKVFLTASLDARTRRRLTQLGMSDAPRELEDVRKGLARRDERDESRASAPLRQAGDAVVLDTSELNLEESVAALIDLLRRRGLVP